MAKRKHIFAIIGSAAKNSSNLKLMQHLATLLQDSFVVTICEELQFLPHFSPELSTDDTPPIVANFREQIASADGVVICAPEYVFSIPSRLKNAIEWCVSTQVFANKPTGIITAAAHGEHAHEELQLIMQTLDASLNKQTTLLIQGIKGKLDEAGAIIDPKTEQVMEDFAYAYKSWVKNYF